MLMPLVPVLLTSCPVHMLGAFVFEDQSTIQNKEVRVIPGGTYSPTLHDFDILDVKLGLGGSKENVASS